MIATAEAKLPNLKMALPGPKAKAIVERDAKYVSPSYTRDYPLVAKRGQGAMIEDVDGNTFLDFAAGIAVCATGHCHPDVVAAIQKQAAELIHLSGTDFYYEGMPQLAEKLSAISPGASTSRPPRYGRGSAQGNQSRDSCQRASSGSSTLAGSIVEKDVV